MTFRFGNCGWLGAALLAAAWAVPGALAEDGKARLEQELTPMMQEFPGLAKLPEADRPRGVKCMVDSFLADIPEAEAGRLADILQNKAPADKTLISRWVATDKGSNPERLAQVNARSAALCPDLIKAMDGD